MVTAVTSVLCSVMKNLFTATDKHCISSSKYYLNAQHACRLKVLQLITKCLLVNKYLLTCFFGNELQLLSAVFF